MAELTVEHFARIHDPGIARELFKLGVTRVIIETSSYCNRRCGYCPNALVDRISTKKYLPDAAYTKVLNELAEIEFAGDIVLHFYNEPLADPQICEKIALAAKLCPKATTEIFSNGDYLTVDYLNRLRDAGLTNLVLSMHLGDDTPWSDTAIISRLSELSVRIDKVAKVEVLQPGVGIKARFPDKKMNITVSHFDYYNHGSDRGGLMDNIVKPEKKDYFPCIDPLTTMNIGWDGSIAPCCHVYPDAPGHKEYVAGNLKDFPDIFAAYAGGPLADWRRSLAGPHGRDSAPCATCKIGVRNADQKALIKATHDRAVQAYPQPA